MQKLATFCHLSHFEVPVCHKSNFVFEFCVTPLSRFLLTFFQQRGASLFLQLLYNKSFTSANLWLFVKQLQVLQVLT